MSASRPKQLVRAFTATVAGAIDRGVGRAASLGIGAYAWPFLVSIGLGVGLLGVREDRFAHGLMRRRASMEWMAQGLWSIAAFLPFVLLLTLGVGILRRRAGNPRSLGELYVLHVRRLAFLTALPLVVGMGERIEASHAFLTLAFATMTAGLATYSAYYWFTDEPEGDGRVARLWPPILLAAAAVTYTSIVIWIAIQNHLSFNTARSDLGYYMSVFRQSSQGIPLGCSLCGGGTHLTGHFDPILLFLSPLYLIYPWAETLLVIQAVWLASGALPVYLYTRHEIGHRGAALALALAYLAFPALHGVQFFDFHSLALCIPLFVWLLYFLVRGSAWGYFVTLGLVLLVREDMPLALLGVSVFAVFRGGKAARFGWITLLVSVAYFVVAKAFLMGRIDPLNSTGSEKGGYAYYYEEMIPAGGATKALVGMLLTDPGFVLGKILTEDKLDYVAKLLVPLLGLPLLARGRIMLGYGAALTLLASRQFLFSIHFHYSSPLIPFLFVLAAGALGRLARGEVGLAGISEVRASRALALGVLVSSLLCSWKFGGIAENWSFRGGFRSLERVPRPEQLETDRWLRKVAGALPKGAKIAASSRVLTHLGKVTHVYMLDSRETEYVIAGPNQKADGRTMAQEEAAGHLRRIDGFRNLNLYKADWTGVPPSAPRAPAPEGPDRDGDSQ
jgi:uncharacterized membrane protein